MLKIFIAKDKHILYKYILEFNQRKQNGMEKFLTSGFLPNYTENLVKVILFINIFVLFLIGKNYIYLFNLTSNHNLSISLF